MKITGADHINWRVNDLKRSLRFYRDVLGFEPFGLDEYKRQERPIVSLRISPMFILHLAPDPSFDPGPTGDYDHLALVVERTDADALEEQLKASGVEVERRAEGVVATELTDPITD